MEHFLRYIRDHWPTEPLVDLLAIISGTLQRCQQDDPSARSRSPSPILSVGSWAFPSGESTVGEPDVGPGYSQGRSVGARGIAALIGSTCHFCDRPIGLVFEISASIPITDAQVCKALCVIFICLFANLLGSQGCSSTPFCKLIWPVLGGDPALIGSSSSLHSEACNALGVSDGVIHSRIS